MKFIFQKAFVFIALISMLVFSSQVNAATKASISITSTKASLVVGQSKLFAAKVVNGKGYPVIWKTNRAAVATVSNGMVKANGVGSALITATIPKLKLISKPMAVTVVKKAYTDAQSIYKLVNKSIVYLESYNKYGKLVSSGSGIIISSDGQVVTNYHVVTDYSEITKVKLKFAYKFDGKTDVLETSAAIGFSVQKDLVLLKFNARGVALPAAKLGDSNSVQTGEKVYALGSPRGVQNSITEGIVSNRNVVMGKNNYIQTSAPMSPGNSGGALVNKYGEVIGVNDLSLRDAQNMNYAIPINIFKAMPKTKSMTLLQVNQAYYIAATGKGTLNEEENNDTADYGDKIPYADATIYGTMSSNNDIDYSYFVTTSYMDVSIYGAVLSAMELSADLVITIEDDATGDTLTSNLVLDSASKKYYPSLAATVSPGSYSIKVSTKTGTTNNYTNADYGVKVELAPAK